MPKTISIHNSTRPLTGPLHVQYCDTFFTQLRGLTFRSHLRPGEGLLLAGSRDSRLDSAIHMLFVPMDLGVIWISAAMRVVDTRLAKAWRPAYFPSHPAKYVLEVQPERRSEFEVGDGVEFGDA